MLFAKGTVPINEGLQVLQEWSERNGTNVKPEEDKCHELEKEYVLGNSYVPIWHREGHYFFQLLLQPTFTFTYHIWRRKAYAISAFAAVKVRPLVSATNAEMTAL